MSGRSRTSDSEVTALFTTGGGDESDTIREQAIAVTRRAEARRKALCPLSYRCMEHRAGFEPATSRVAGEVTEIFTTDREGVGGERSMLLLPRRGGRFSGEVTDSFTTARPMLLHRPLKGTLGNRRYRRSVTATQFLSSRKETAPGLVQAFPRPHPGACAKGGIRTRFTVVRSIRHLHHQRRLSREECGKPSYENSIAALSTRRSLRTLRVRSAIGVPLIASFPPAGPARSGTRLSSASPGIRVSRSGSWPGKFERAARQATKNPPERLAREGP